MDPRNCAALPVFHAITGCDTTVSSFMNRKEDCLESLAVFSDVTEAFEQLLLMEDVSDSTMSVLERFVVLLYSDQASVNDARKELFSQKSCKLENLPPIQASLVQHIKHTSYQANCWKRALCLDPYLVQLTRDGRKKVRNGLCRPICQKLLSLS